MANNNKKITDTFSAELSKKLMSNLDIVSSEPSGFEEEIGKAVSGIEEARRVTETGIGASFERQRIEAEQAGEQRLTGAREARRGFATNTAILEKIEKDTEKSLRDLDLREQEALATGRTETATQIANLKIARIQFQEQAKQQAFSNMLGLGGLFLSAEQERRLQEQTELTNVMDKLKFFTDNNIIGNMSEEDRATFETKLDLPEGTLKNIQSKGKFEIQQIGRSLIEIERDPKTGEIINFNPFYTAPEQDTTRDDLAEDVFDFGVGLREQNLRTREEALDYFNFVAPAYIDKYGEDSIARFMAVVDRTFPAPVAEDVEEGGILDFFFGKRETTKPFSMLSPAPRITPQGSFTPPPALSSVPQDGIGTPQAEDIARAAQDFIDSFSGGK